MKSRIKWNGNQQYDRSMYGSGDTTTPTPDSGLISFTAESSTASTKKLFKLKHCFDYYKDLSGVGAWINKSSGGQMKNYIEGDDIYYAITKDMVWRVNDDYGSRTLTTRDYNQGISYWAWSWTCEPAGWDDAVHFNGHDPYISIYPIYNNSVKFSYDKHTNFNKLGTRYSVSSSDIGEGHTDYWQSSRDVYGTLYNCTSNKGTYRMCYPFPSYFSRRCSSLTDYATGASETCNDNELNWYIETSPNNFSSYGYASSSTYTDWDWYWEYEYDSNGKVKKDSNGNEIKHKKYTSESKTYYSGDSQSTNHPSNKCLKYPTKNEQSGWQYYFYVDYVDISPVFITRTQLRNNQNYVIPEIKFTFRDSVHDGWTNWHWRDSDMHIKETLMHEYCEPVICPYAYTYGNTISIGDIKVKYQLSRPDAHEMTDSKTIPIYFTKYRCEAYKKK